MKYLRLSKYFDHNTSLTRQQIFYFCTYGMYLYGDGDGRFIHSIKTFNINVLSSQNKQKIKLTQEAPSNTIKNSCKNFLKLYGRLKCGCLKSFYRVQKHVINLFISLLRKLTYSSTGARNVRNRKRVKLIYIACPYGSSSVSIWFWETHQACENMGAILS